MTTISDNFNRADDTNISTGAPFAWTEVVSNHDIFSNRLRHNDSAAGAARADSDLSTTDHYSQSTIVQLVSNAGNRGGQYTRFSSSAHTAYLAVYSQDFSLHGFYKVVAGTFTALGTFTAPSTIYQQFRFSANGSTLSLTNTIDGSLGSTTDSSITTGTRAGLYSYGNTSPLQMAHDDFEAADLGGVAFMPAPNRRHGQAVKRAAYI